MIAIPTRPINYDPGHYKGIPLMTNTHTTTHDANNVLLPLINPKLVSQLSAVSGVFNNKDMTEVEFCASVMGKWIQRAKNAGNAVSETPQHLEEARNLYDFYIQFQANQNARKGVLNTLYQTGSIEQARAVLEANLR